MSIVSSKCLKFLEVLILENLFFKKRFSMDGNLLASA